MTLIIFESVASSYHLGDETMVSDLSASVFQFSVSKDRGRVSEKLLRVEIYLTSIVVLAIFSFTTLPKIY